MSEIKITGVIIGPEEADFIRYCMPELLENGILTASDDVINAINQETEILHICINSFGGDVLAGKSISIAIKKWSASHPGRQIVYEIGALAASMAAALVVLAPMHSEIHVYDETTLMFHSATTSLFGAAPGELKDTAERLQQFNDLVRDSIISRSSLDEATVNAWFQDCRAGWLSAKQLVNCGLANCILAGSCPELPKQVPTDTKLDSNHYQKISAVYALYNSATQTKETKMKNEDPEKTPVTTPVPETDPEKENPANPEQGSPESPEKEKPANPEQESPESPEKEKPANPEQESPEEETVENLKKQNADLMLQVKALNAKLDKLSGGLKIQQAHSALHASTDFASAFIKLRASKLSGPEFEAEYARIRNADPKGFQAFLDKQSRVFPN